MAKQKEEAAAQTVEQESTGSLLDQTVFLQSFCLLDELCNRTLTPRSPRVEGLRPSK